MLDLFKLTPQKRIFFKLFLFLIIIIITIGLSYALLKIPQVQIHIKNMAVTLFGSLDNETEPQQIKTISPSYSISPSLTRPAISEEALGLNISVQNGAVIINSSLFNCIHKTPSFELKSIKFLNPVPTDKYNVVIKNNKYEFDFSNLIVQVDSDLIRQFEHEIICDNEPDYVRGCKAYWLNGGVVYDFCDNRFNQTLEI